jgi:hypothetical protein
MAAFDRSGGVKGDGGRYLVGVRWCRPGYPREGVWIKTLTLWRRRVETRQAVILA